MGGSRLADLTTLILTIQDDGTDLPRQPRLNFIGAGVSVAEDTGNDRIDVTIPGGGGGGGYDTIQEEGSPLTQRSTIDFVGAGVTATDTGAKTQVSIPGGGGGSGLVNDVDNVLLVDDFFYDEPDNLPTWLAQTKYSLQTQGIGTLGVNSGISNFGIVSLNAPSGIGENVQLNTGFENAGQFSLDIDIVAQFVIGLGSLVNVMVFAGVLDDFINDGTTLAAAEGSLGDSMYFRYDPASSANWFAVTMSGGTKTETDTGVATASAVRFKMEMIKTDSVPNVVFKINGSTVATHTTNLPSGSQTAGTVSLSTKVAGTPVKDMDLDFWLFSQARTV